jgi:hypothetical protein
MATITGRDPLPERYRKWGAREDVKLPDSAKTRMPRLLQPSNWLDKLYAVDKRADKTQRDQRISSRRRRLGYHGEIDRNPAYEGRIDFSTDDGYTFSDPAIDVEGNRIIQMRLTLSQHETDRMIQGWKLDWYLPTHWEWADGLGRRTFEETNSNPMIVTRVVLSPNNPVPVGFRVIVTDRYY